MKPTAKLFLSIPSPPLRGVGIKLKWTRTTALQTQILAAAFPCSPRASPCCGLADINTAPPGCSSSSSHELQLLRAPSSSTDASHRHLQYQRKSLESLVQRVAAVGHRQNQQTSTCHPSTMVQSTPSGVASYSYRLLYCLPPSAEPSREANWGTGKTASDLRLIVEPVCAYDAIDCRALL